MERRSLHAIPDDELLARLVELLNQARRTESDLIAHIGEVDERKLYAREASPSMFAYCTNVLHLSKAEAYLRIAAARAAREHPLLLQMLADGRLHLSGVGKLAPHLTRNNAALLLARAAHKTKRQIEELIAELAPRPDAPTVVRKLPQRLPPAAPRAASALQRDAVTSIDAFEGAALGTEPARDLRLAEWQRPGLGETPGCILRPDAVVALRPSVPTPVEPLAPGRYKFQFTAGTSLKDKLERLQALMRTQVSDGDLAVVIEAAVTEKLERLEAKRFAKTNAPRKTLEQTPTAPSTRRIPAAVRRAVHERDGNRCRYRDAQGRRCSERHRLEYHHRYPFGLGGDHSPANVSLLCHSHNALMADVDCGRQTIARNRSSRAVRRSPAVISTHPRAG